MSQKIAGSGRSLVRRSLFPWSAQLTRRHPTLKAAEDDRTLGERVADDIASFGGSWPFIFLLLFLIAFWMVLNTVLLAHVLRHKPFDPYPYIALNLVLSALAGIQAPIIMMSQNRAASKDEALANHHYEDSQKTEHLLTITKELLDANTELTRQVHDLTVQIHQIVAPRAPSPG
jgi:uncharacterized membrane protein